jgi:hypothetical protein
VALCAGVALAAATPARAARARPGAPTEWDAGLCGALARRDLWGAALGAGWQRGQTRFATTATGGAAGGAAAVRLDATLQFVLLGSAPTGTTPYAGLGLAFVGAAGAAGAAYLTGVVGVERTAAGWRGWFVEVGLGGGVRAAAGLRWRPGAPR